jgi:hypothetical protein
MNIKIYLILALCFSLSIVTTSCTSNGDDFNYGKKALLISGTETDPLVKFTVEDTPSSYQVSVKSTCKVDHDVTVTLGVDNSLVDEYNKSHNTNFYPAPDGSVAIEYDKVLIQSGTSLSTTANVQVVSTENFEEGRTYVIPVTIKKVDNALDQVLLEPSKTIFLKISRVINFVALNVNNAGLSSNYIFADAKAVNLTNFTYEIKLFANRFGASGGSIERVCSFEEKDESNASMLRFGEAGMDGNQLQWVSPAGSIPSTTRFATSHWYMISLVYDGSAFTMYVNGVKDASANGSGKSCNFQRFELGMSWGGYNSSQLFPGRICEVRVWKRALSSSEIANGLCGVDAKSNGLVAYWKMNEGTGHIFKDATGNGYDMDWSDTWRADGEGDLNHHDYSSAVNWTNDSNNKCAQ